MVRVRAFQPSSGQDRLDIEDWLTHLQLDLDINDIEPFRQACDLARNASLVSIENNTNHHASNCFYAGLEIAEILADLKLDQDTLIAAILYRAVREQRLDIQVVRQNFGETVAKLIEGVQQMAAISAFQHQQDKPVLGDTERQVENVRKMLVALVDDVRVALIKLAERTWALRTVKNEPQERQQKVAREVSDIYAPLAHRLGIGHIKWELEDMAFRFLSPDKYKEIASLLDERRLDRDRYIASVLQQLETQLSANGIDAVITGRAKHIYSIWRKMQSKSITFNQVYDVRAVRVLVPELKDCYAVLGIIHSLWQHIPKEFDDYIATPKRNGYRSLHTAVIAPEGKVLEVQIRTHDMHEEAEYGVCSHWRYKGSDRSGVGQSYEEKIEWLRQVLQWHEEVGDLGSLVEELQLEIEPDRVYVFTPAGHVVDLPNESTPIDFAYRVHSEVGHHCRGAKVNGRIVPLNYKLSTGEQVEVMTSKQATPSRDWLNPASGYIASSRTRNKIQHWFKQENKEKNAIAGRSLVEQELKRLALFPVDFKTLAPEVNYKHEEDMFAAVGAGDLRISQIIHAAQAQIEPPQHHDQLHLKLPSTQAQSGQDMDFKGVDNLLSHIAGCCQPVPDDNCTGYITLGRGVSIHRSDCANLLKLKKDDPERIIEVHWSSKPDVNYPVDMIIQALDRSGLLKDITTILANDGVNVTAIKSESSDKSNLVDLRLTVEIPNLSTLSKVMTKIRQLPNMLEVKRYKQGG